MNAAPHVVVVGGGFGGLEVCRQLARANKRGKLQLTLISKENFFQFNPLLPEVATGAVETRHIVYPLRKFCAPRRIRFIRNKVRAVDPQRRILTLHNDIEVSYDHLVIACGAEPNYFGVPGAEENAFPFATLMDAIRLRAHVVEMWELADQATDHATRCQLLSFVVAGAGTTGVEVCSELVRMFRRTMYRLYPNIPPECVSVHVIDASDRVLPALHEKHSAIAERHLRSCGVNIVLERKVVRVDAERVRLDDGRVIPAHTLIWTTGVRASRLEHPWPFPQGRGGRLKTDARCNVVDDVWAVGDVADCRDVDGEAIPQVAQGAIQMGEVVALNLLARVGEGREVKIRYRDYGYFVGLGKHSTVATISGFPIAGWPAFYLWALVYMVKMVGFTKQLEVATDILKGFFIDHDTSQVHARRRMLRERDLNPDLSGPDGGGATEVEIPEERQEPPSPAPG